MLDTNSPQYLKGKLGEDYVLKLMQGCYTNSFESKPFQYESVASTWDFAFRENGVKALGEIKTYDATKTIMTLIFL